MKIGIITFHSAHNYGAILQCYALQEFLKTYGHNVHVIDYNLKEINKYYKWFDIARFKTRHLKTIIKECLILPQRRRRYVGFNRFKHTYLNLFSSNCECQNYFDLVIIGSDQVWNINLTGGFDSFYWGKSIDVSQTKLISYAASMEEYWGEPKDKIASTLLKRFSSISVREESLKGIISNLLPLRRVDVCVDPTLLLAPNLWEKLSTNIYNNKPYLLLYQVRSSKKVYDYAKSVAKSKGLKLVCLSAAVGAKNTYHIAGASPSDFIGLFKNASFVIATSFHGTIFSLLFHKEFITLKLGDGKDSRYSELLCQLDLLSRLKGINEELNNCESIDYDVVDKKIQEMKESSVKYLEQFL